MVTSFVRERAVRTRSLPSATRISMSTSDGPRGAARIAGRAGRRGRRGGGRPMPQLRSSIQVRVSARRLTGCRRRYSGSCSRVPRPLLAASAAVDLRCSCKREPDMSAARTRLSQVVHPCINRAATCLAEMGSSGWRATHVTDGSMASASRCASPRLSAATQLGAIGMLRITCLELVKGRNGG